MPPHTATDHTEIAAVVLAGGQGRRMGNVDKALLPLDAKPLLAHVLAALHPQVSTIVINSNKPARDYAVFGLPVIADTLPAHPGPLAGVLSMLEHSRQPLILAVPCDTPNLPRDLVKRMRAALEHEHAEVCTVNDGTRLHPAILLVRRATRASLAAFLAGGGRRVLDWLQTMPLAVVDYADQPDAFRNINTPEDLQRLEDRQP